MQESEMPPVVLTIAGSDNSCGAGAQADLKTFTALGVYGLTAMTCVVAEAPGCVTAIQPVTSRIIADQIRLCLEAFPVAAIKTGLLYSRAAVEIVCDNMENLIRSQQPPWLVVDPVMVATSGTPLLKPDALAAYQDRLFRLAALVTPNLDEAGTLLGQKVETLDQMRVAAANLGERFGTAFLLKGGHLRGSAAVDLLYCDGRLTEFSAPYIKGVSTHGTGCTYSAAITAWLARGAALPDAIAKAKRYVTKAIRRRFSWLRESGQITAALNHFRT